MTDIFTIVKCPENVRHVQCEEPGSFSFIQITKHPPSGGGVFTYDEYFSSIKSESVENKSDNQLILLIEVREEISSFENEIKQT